MSYFLAGFGECGLDIDRFEEAFVATVPSHIRNTRSRIETKTSVLVQYGTDKPIKDIFIRSTSGDSWLALLGTPLVTFRSHTAQQDFLHRFARDPRRVLRTDVDGCFALLYCSASDGTLSVATDYNNTIPVYYASANGRLYISSHELALARYLSPPIDPEGFAQTIQLKLTWGSQCRFKGIRKLLPCQIVTFDHAVPTGEEVYWQPSDEELWPDDFNDTLNRWSTILKASVKAYHDCSTNRSVVCDFTAGEDSRLLLAQCHALNIPFKAQVTGNESDTDVIVAREASRRTGFELLVHRAHSITQRQVRENATYISLVNDGYEDYFQSCSFFANDEADPVLYFDYVKYCGAPGGEAFRGSYYVRGKAFRPSSKRRLDTRFFVRMKYLLDFYPGLLRNPDDEWKEAVFGIAERAVDEVGAFPIGTRIDHLLREFQTCNLGLIYKNPRYNPFASRDMTRAVYSIWPHFKRGGRLTKACTEILYPELALVKTQNGVPTIRRTPLRFYLFLPEHVAFVRRVTSGAVRRLLKIAESDKPGYGWKDNAATIATIMNEPPFAGWFASPAGMVTGHLYRSDVLRAILAEARGGGTRYVPILGRIICQELACRWVYAG